MPHAKDLRIGTALRRKSMAPRMNAPLALLTVRETRQPIPRLLTVAGTTAATLYKSMAQLDACIPPKLLKVRRLETHEVESYRELRLEGLKNNPEAFGASWEDEAGKPVAWWAERLEINTVLGGWIEDSPLLGVAGFHLHGGAKHRHKGVLWGMYVRPQARGTGLAVALVQRIVEQAQPLVEEICLTVVASNAAACRLYRGAGFEQYGLERRALRVGNEYYDEVLMALALHEPREPAIRD